MATVLLQCPVHGVLSVGGFMEGAGDAIFANSTINCPECGRASRILDGSYQMRDHLSLPTIFMPTPAERNRLRNMLIWAEEKLAASVVDETAVAESLERGLRKEAPAVAGWLDRLGGAKSMGLATWLMLLLMVYQIVTSGQTVSPEDLQRAVDEGVRQIQEHQNQEAPRAPEPETPQSPQDPRP